MYSNYLRLAGEPVGWVDLVDTVAPGLGDVFEEEHEEDVLLAAIKEIITLLFLLHNNHKER